ncbi:MAG: acyloxyacyl hydrolase [Bacteroidota bacterium]
MSLLTLAMSLPAQHSWDARDPLDVGWFDYGDNKLLLYNAIGIGLSLWLSESDAQPSLNSQLIEIHHYREYRKTAEEVVLSLSYTKTWVIRRFLEMGVESRFMTTTGQVTTSGAGISPCFRWYAINADDWSLRLDAGVGPNLFFDEFPKGGTRFNFSTTYGPTFTFKAPRRSYILGLSSMHISNADIKGRSRNPSLDAVGLRAGIAF